MIEHSPQTPQTSYEQAPTTNRSAGFLAARYEFSGIRKLAKLAEKLPLEATVLDVGAGASPFGKAVAKRRPDITWINLDYSYHDSAILKEVTEDTPPNVQHIAGDATKLHEHFDPESFDATFSYWLFPHLSLESPEPARLAAKSILNVTKMGGSMALGPVSNDIPYLSLIPPTTFRTTKTPYWEAHPDVFANLATHLTELTDGGKRMARIHNQAGQEIFGTSRRFKGKGPFKAVYDPEYGDYVSIFSSRGTELLYRVLDKVDEHDAKNV